MNNNLYPTLSVSQIQDPNRFYAVPLIGIIAKFIICVPIFIEILFLYIAAGIVTLINSFSVLFTGNYWQTAYEFNLGVLRLSAKLTFFLYGLTNKYPAFGLTIDDPLISLDMAKPQNPNRFFAIPLIGGLSRFILLIPYFIYANVIESATGIASTFIASFSVLFRGKYPEFSYELVRDYVRISQASVAYMAGFSDKYPSFWISMNHQTIKIILIILATLFSVGNVASSFSQNSQRSQFEKFNQEDVFEQTTPYTPDLFNQ